MRRRRRWPAARACGACTRSSGAHVVDGGATMNPSTYELLAGIHAAPAAEVRGPAEQPERDPGRGACRRAVREAGGRRARRTAPQEGLAALLAFDPEQAGRERTGTRSRRPGRACGSAGLRSPPRTTPRAASPPATRSATPATSWWPAASPSRHCARRSRRVAEGAELLTCIAGREPAARPRRRSRPACPTASSSSTTRAASRPGGGCSAPSDRPTAVRPSAYHRLDSHSLRKQGRAAGRRGGAVDPAAEPARRAADAQGHGGQGPRDARHRDARRPGRAPAAHPSRSARHAQDRRARRGGGGDGAGRRALACRCGPMRDRRRKRVEARVFDETGPMVAVWFNQPWIARELGEGAQVLLHGKLRQRNEFWVTEFELAGRRRPGPHGRPRAGPPRQRGHRPGAPAQARSGTTTTCSCATRSSRCRPGCGSRSGWPTAPPRWPAPTSRTTRTRRTGRAGGWRSRSCFLLQLAVAGRRRARREGGRAAALEPAGELVEPWLRSLPFELTGDQRAAFERIDARPGVRAADAAAADGGGGQREDRGGPARDAARGRERPPGGAHGAHRDARRAAPGHPRPAARRPHARSSC